MMTLKPGDKIELLTPLMGGWQGKGTVLHVDDENDANSVVQFAKDDEPEGFGNEFNYCLAKECRRIAP